MADVAAPTIIKAEFSHLGRDLYWKLWAGSGDKFICWVGYDDANWWKNVSPTEHTRTRTGQGTGRIFTIDFDTNEVTISEPAQ
jgi:hypothetical protein